MMKKRILSLVCCLGVVLCFGFCPRAETPATVRLAVTVELQGNPPAPLPDFTFLLEPLQDAPLPEPATLTIRGAGSGTFAPLAYGTPGTYRYTLRQQTDPLPGYRLDDTVYDLTVEVLTDDQGALTASVLLWRQGAQGKAEEARFTNVSTASDPQPGTDAPSGGTTVSSPGADPGTAPQDVPAASGQAATPWGALAALIPQTGDAAHPVLWGLAALASLLVLGLLWARRRHPPQ